jgi:hypothetical protein
MAVNEECERLRAVTSIPDVTAPTVCTNSVVQAANADAVAFISLPMKVIKGKGVEYRGYNYQFDVPREHEKQFLEVIKGLKEAGIKAKVV